MSNKSNINTSKNKLVIFTVAALAMLLMTAYTLNSNFILANASYYDGNHKNRPDIGKSEECVKVVLGCGGQGTVRDNKPIGSIDPAVCEKCMADLTNSQKQDLFTALGAEADICSSIEDLTADRFLELLLDVGVELFTALDILECFEGQ